MKIISQLHFFYKRKIEPGFKVGANSKIVDIGSGDKPFWRADVFVDKLSLGNVQRASNSKTIHDIGFFVDSDAAKMPFRNKEFDFSFCSHLLEHVEDPGAVIKEIARISKSGYVEIPNGIIETIKPFDSHLWFVFQDKKKLIFVRKTKKQHEILHANGNKYQSLLNKIEEPFIRLYWKNKIEYEVIDNYKPHERFKSRVGSSKHYKKPNFDLYLVLIKTMRMMFYRNKKFQNPNIKYTP